MGKHNKPRKRDTDAAKAWLEAKKRGPKLKPEDVAEAVADGVPVHWAREFEGLTFDGTLVHPDGTVEVWDADKLRELRTPVGAVIRWTTTPDGREVKVRGGDG